VGGSGRTHRSGTVWGRLWNAVSGIPADTTDTREKRRMSTPGDIDDLLQYLEREGLVLRLGIGDATVWFAAEFRENMIAERLAMLPDEPMVSVATAAAVLNVPHSHVIAEVHAATLAGHDSGQQVRVRREALVQRITTLGLPHPASSTEPSNFHDSSTRGNARP
jgi:excisionase family DNA binding protein